MNMANLPLKDVDLFRQQAYLGGRWCDADSGATVKVNNPATGEILGTVPKMGANETWRAVEAAKDAFGEWSRKPAKERSILMRRWYDLIMANVDELGALMTADRRLALPRQPQIHAGAASLREADGDRLLGRARPVLPFADVMHFRLHELACLRARLPAWMLPCPRVCPRWPASWSPCPGSACPPLRYVEWLNRLTAGSASRERRRVSSVLGAACVSRG